jgi:hypothetical protein
MQKFTLTSKQNPNNYEILGFHISFYEKKIRGEDTSSCIVEFLEDSEISITEIASFASWEKMKENFPTLKSMLVEFAHDDKWDARWRQNERVCFVESITGNEGLYDVNQVVSYDYEDESEIVEFKEKAKPKKKV